MKKPRGILVVMKFRNLSPGEKAKIFRLLYGYSGSSNYGKYCYPKEGVLSSIPHIKLTRGVFILRKGDERVIKDALKGRNVEIEMREVMLSSRDLKILRRS